MTDETIVAVYDTAAHAQAAVSSLKEAGVPADAIHVHAGTEGMSGGASDTVAGPREEGFWASLFGGSPDHDTTVYDRSVDSGSTVVTVKTPEATPPACWRSWRATTRSTSTSGPPATA